MKNKIILLIISIIVFIFLWKVGYRNVETIKLASTNVWNNAGYKVVGYEGYQWDIFLGGKVWYLLRKVDDNNITYNGFLSKWGKEYHIYNLKAIDAISPK